MGKAALSRKKKKMLATEKTYMETPQPLWQILDVSRSVNARSHIRAKQNLFFTTSTQFDQTVLVYLLSIIVTVLMYTFIPMYAFLRLIILYAVSVTINPTTTAEYTTRG